MNLVTAYSQNCLFFADLSPCVKMTGLRNFTHSLDIKGTIRFNIQISSFFHLNINQIYPSQLPLKPCKNKKGRKFVSAEPKMVSFSQLTTCDFVTIFQRPFFNLLHKIIRFGDIMRFSDSFCRDQKCH